MVTTRATPKNQGTFQGRRRKIGTNNANLVYCFFVLLGLSLLHMYRQTVVEFASIRITEEQDKNDDNNFAFRLQPLEKNPKATIKEETIDNNNNNNDRLDDEFLSKRRWIDAMKQAKEMLDNGDNSNEHWKAECLVPNTAQTEELLRRLEAEKHKQKTTNGVPTLQQRALESSTNKAAATAFADPLVALPVLNAGMPKLGSTTLYNYFRCKGLNATHWQEGTDHFEGICMRDAVRVGLPPLETCAPSINAIAQMDVAFPMGVRNDAVTIHLMRPAFASEPFRDDCFFPQLSLLEAFHKESPSATFVLAFRPMQDWVQSILGWSSMMERLSLCHLPNLPRGVPDLSSSSSNNDNNNHQTDDYLKRTMAQFFCSHVLHVRKFVEDHPSHALLELDLYDPTTPDLLDRFFPSKDDTNNTDKDSCWAVSNRSKHDPTNGWDLKIKDRGKRSARNGRKRTKKREKRQPK